MTRAEIHRVTVHDVILFHIYASGFFCRRLVGKTFRNVCHSDSS